MCKSSTYHCLNHDAVLLHSMGNLCSKDEGLHGNQPGSWLPQHLHCITTQAQHQWRSSSRQLPATCIRRAVVMLGCGMSPSPPISLLVSTMITLLRHSLARMRAQSRRDVPAHSRRIVMRMLH